MVSARSGISVIVAGGGIHIDAWASKYHVVLAFLSTNFNFNFSVSALD